MVAVVGYFNMEYEGTALFPRLEDAQQHLVTKGIWLKVGWPVSEDRKALGNGYVRVQGTFDATKGMGFKGMLRDITKIEPTAVTLRGLRGIGEAVRVTKEAKE